MSTRIIAFVNQKGGVAKTTTCLNVAAALATKGKRVLLIDLDPQGNLTSSVGLNDLDSYATTYELLTQNADIADIIIDNVNGLYDVVPTDIRLALAEMELVTKLGRESILKRQLQTIQDAYDYVLIDCPPNLGILTLNALTTCNEYIIPLQAEYLALKGLVMLQKTIEEVKQELNPGLSLSGVVLTMYDNRTNLSQEVLENITEFFTDKVFKTRIRKNVSLAEAPAMGNNIISYKRDSNGAKDYMALGMEIMEQED